MKRRIIGIIAAFALASMGTIVLVSYVQSARNDAVAAEASVVVWVVRSAIAEGTPADDIEGSVARATVPGRLKVDGAIAELEELDGLVAATALLPGEQVVAGRFTTPALARQGDVPDGLLQVTVELEPQRALGGRVRAGDSVGVLMSFEPFDIEGAIISGEPVAGQLKTSNTTHLELHKVLVVSVQISDDEGVPDVTGEDAADDEGGVVSAPKESLLVTLALDAPSVERVVFAAEFGTVWLSAEPAGASEAGTQIVDRGNVYSSEVAP